MLDYKNPTLVVETSKIEPGKIHWKAPSNLALVKYWGKHGQQLPRNPSISFTLNSAFTETVLEYKAKEGGGKEISVEFNFQGEPKPAFADKVNNYLNSLVEIYPFLQQLDFVINSANSFPHSAGIASSASSMCALALCLCSLEDQLFNTLDDDTEFDRKASYLARLGSGSASRSVFPHIAVWGKAGEIADSSDEYAIPFESQVHEVFHTFHDDILIVSQEEKKVSSSAGHGLMNGNPYAEPRYLQAKQRLHLLLPALQQGDLETFGRICEDEALTLHALMMTSNPSYVLLRPNTLEMIERLRQYRADTKHPVYFSLDAGPNLHVLYPEDIIHEVRPFVEEQLVPLCHEEQWLADWVGEGPEQI